MNIELVVLNGHTLCYRDQGARKMNVLQASVRRGAGFYVRNGDIAFAGDTDTVRLARTDDFEHHGISLEGYRADPRYIYDRG